MKQNSPIHKICTLSFDNGSSINLALIAYNPESMCMKQSVWIERTFEEMLAEARSHLTTMEERGRGAVKSFTIGGWIRVEQN